MKNPLLVGNDLVLLGMLWLEIRRFTKSRVSAMPPLGNLSHAVIDSAECGGRVGCVESPSLYFKAL